MKLLLQIIRYSIFIIIFTTTLIIQCLGQYSWFRSFRGQDYVEIARVATDTNNNVFTVGDFNDDVNVFDSKYLSGGSFLLKLDSHGELIWQKRFTYSSLTFYALNFVKTDIEGNVYISGQFPESMSIDGITLTGQQFNSFVAKFNSSGELQWTQTFVGVQNIFDIDVNDSGNLAVYGISYNNLKINNITLTHNGDVFVALIETDGTALWARSFESQSGRIWPIAISLDNANSIYFNGTLPGNLELDNKKIFSTGLHDMFFAKINKNNNCEWLTLATREVPSILKTSEIIEYGSLATDTEGNLYAGGTFWQNMKLDDHLLKSDGAPESIAANFYILKFDPLGNLLWMNGISNDTPRDNIENVIYQNNKLYFSGIVNETPYFTIYNSSGELLQNTVLFPLDGDLGSGISVDSQDSIYMSGRINTVRNGPPFSGYVFKYNPSKLFVEVAETITGNSVICNSNELISFSTPPILNATSYEWKILFNETTITLISELPHIQISLEKLSVTDDFSICVRGKNSSSNGSYSEYKNVVVDNNFNKITIEATCKEILVTQGKGEFEWYKNNEAFDESLKGNDRIKPGDSGEYYVTVTYLCGTQKSNVISYKNLFFPNIITPDNGDDLNQYFVLPEHLDTPNLTILDRWGKEIYYTKNYKNDWDGANLASGVYYYSIVSKICNSNPILGTLTIRR